MSPHNEQEVSPPPRVMVADRALGDSEPVWIIAEAGVNHDGDVSKALALIDAAAAAGADAVKFQLFTASHLVTRQAKTAPYQQRACGCTSQYELLHRLELPEESLATLHQRCVVRSILMLATPFDEYAVGQIQQLHLPAIKIASSDIANDALLRAAVDTRRPLIVSTGAATRREICAAVDLIEELGARDRLVLMHCVSSYPTPLEHANLRAIATLRRTFRVPVGFSDHTTSVYTGAWAVAAGACLLEKHFTLDSSATGPDHAMSLSPDELRDYVETARLAQASMGDGSLDLSPIEQDVRTAARRSVVAARDIEAGALLTPDMLATKRPGTGLTPDAISNLVGRRAVHAIPRDVMLTLDMVQ